MDSFGNYFQVRDAVARGATFLHTPNYSPENTSAAAEDDWARDRWSRGLPVTCDYCFQTDHPGTRCLLKDTDSLQWLPIYPQPGVQKDGQTDAEDGE